MTSMLYFARCNGRVKIGISNDVGARLRALQCGNPDPIEVIATFRGGRTLEAACHGLLASDRTSGEWFNDGARIAELIEILSAAQTQQPWREVENEIEAPASAPRDADDIVPFDEMVSLLGFYDRLDRVQSRIETFIEWLQAGNANRERVEALDKANDAVDHFLATLKGANFEGADIAAFARADTALRFIETEVPKLLPVSFS